MVDLDLATRNLRNSTLTLSDGDTPANTLVVPIEEGNLNWTETDAAVIVMNRGVISHRAVSSDVPLTWSFTAKYVALKGRGATGADPTVYDAMHGTGNASSWVSTEDCGAYAFDMIWTLTSPCLASASDEDEVVTFPSCHTNTYNPQEQDEYNIIAFAGDCLATKPTVVRS